MRKIGRSIRRKRDFSHARSLGCDRFKNLTLCMARVLFTGIAVFAAGEVPGRTLGLLNGRKIHRARRMRYRDTTVVDGYMKTNHILRCC